MFNRGSDHSELTWKEFEHVVEAAVKKAANDESWRFAAQWPRKYVTSGGETIGVRLDVHLAQRRQGGTGIVIDAKHFKTAPLNRQEVNSAEEYRRRCKASYAILAVSEATVIPPSVREYVEDNPRFGIMRVDRSFTRKLKKFLNNINSAN